MIYLLIYLYIIFNLIVNYKNKKRIEKINIVFIFIVLSLISGLRYRIGVDTPMYISLYQDVPTLGDMSIIFLKNTRYEIGWIFLISLFKSLKISYQTFQLLLSFALNFSIYNFYKNYKKDSMYLIVFLYYISTFFVYYNFEIQREALAIAIFMHNFKNLFEKKWIKYIFYCIIGILFHQAAIVLIILPVFISFNIFRKRYLYFCVFLLLFLLNLSLKNILLSFSVIFPPILEGKIKHYLFYSDIFSLSQSNIIIFKTVVQFIIYLIILVLKNNEDEKNKNYLELTINKLIIVSLSIKLLGTKLPILNRFNNYFTPFYIILIVYIINNLCHTLKYKKVILFISIILISIKNISSYLKFNEAYSDYQWVKYYPYSSVLNKKINIRREKINIERGFGLENEN